MPDRLRTAVTAGYMPLDIVCYTSRVWRRAGGTAGNVAAILAFLGWQAVLAGRVGNDAAGHELLEDLATAGVDTNLVHTDDGAATNRIIHHIEPVGHRYAYSCPRCQQPLPRSRPLTLAQVDGVITRRARPDVYFFDRANAATVALAERYASAGRLVVYEPSTPASTGLLQRAMAAADIVKGSEEHGPELVATFESGRAGQVRVITNGANGARFRIGTGAWHTVGVYRVDPLDSAGAGDWTTAAMLDRLAGHSMNVERLSEAIRFGHSLAALNCALPGARGLMEARSRASALGLATKLRRHHPVAPIPVTPTTSRPRPGSCPACLQDVQVDYTVDATCRASG